MRLLPESIARWFVAVLVAGLVIGTRAEVRAGDFSLVWSTIETEHFAVHYYAPLDDVAQRVAVVAERSHRVLAPAMDHEPEEKTQIVIVDTTDSSNGFASVLPRNSIRLYLSTPTGQSNLVDHDDYLFALVAHEYTHILHLDTIAGLPRLVNKVIGKTWAPNQVQPKWVIEGIATYQESKRTSGGRIRNAMFDADLRVHTLADKIAGLDAMSNGPRAWPHGNVAYQYGSHFLTYVFDRYGEDNLRELSWSYGSNPIPWSLNRTIAATTGRSFADLYGEWRGFLADKYAMQLEAIERQGRREGRRLTFSGESNTDPEYTEDGKHLVWRQSDGLSRARFLAMPVGGNVGEAFDWATIDREGPYDLLSDGSMVLGITRHYRTDYSFSDLYHWERSTKELRRLTRGLRAREPALSPDQRQLAFTINGASRRMLAIQPLRADASHTVIWSGAGRFDQCERPSWSPDGKSIAFSAFRRGGHRDILIYDVASKVTRELMHDRAQDLDPVFDPAGDYLYYSSDRSGVYNIYAHELATGKTYQVTNVVGSARVPAVSPDGKHMAYQGFDVGGEDLYEIELDRSRWFEPLLYVNNRPAPTSIRNDEVEASTPRPYRAIETMAPQTYRLQLVTNSFGEAINVQTSGGDIVGHHGYSVASTVGLNHGDVSVGTSYAYRRLWPSLSLAAMRNAARRSGVILDGVNTRYTEEHWGLTATMGLPVLRTTDGEGTMYFAYDVDWLVNTEDEYVGPDPGAQVPRYPETDVTLAGLALRFSYSDARRYVYRLGEQEGQSFYASVGFNHPGLGSDFRSLSLDYRWQTFRKLPWGVTPVLSVRVAGGLRTTDRNRAGVYVLGGMPEQDVVSAVLDSLRTGRSGYLRGFPSRAAFGTQYHLANIEYRQELWNIERGLLTFPVYVRRLHMAALLDVGNAFYDEFDPSDFKVAVGGALRLDVLFGFFEPGAFDIGYARGLTDGGVGQYWFLVTGEL